MVTICNKRINERINRSEKMTWENNLPEPKEDYFRLDDGEKKEITFKNEGIEAKDNYNNDVVRFDIECEGKTLSWDVRKKNPLSRDIAAFERPREGRKFLVSRKGKDQKDTRYTINEVEE